MGRDIEESLIALDDRQAPRPFGANDLRATGAPSMLAAGAASSLSAKVAADLRQQDLRQVGSPASVGASGSAWHAVTPSRHSANDHRRIG